MFSRGEGQGSEVGGAGPCQHHQSKASQLSRELATMPGSNYTEPKLPRVYHDK